MQHWPNATTKFTCHFLVQACIVLFLVREGGQLAVCDRNNPGSNRPDTAWEKARLDEVSNNGNDGHLHGAMVSQNP